MNNDKTNFNSYVLDENGKLIPQKNIKIKSFTVDVNDTNETYDEDQIKEERKKLYKIEPNDNTNYNDNNEEEEYDFIESNLQSKLFTKVFEKSCTKKETKRNIKNKIKISIDKSNKKTIIASITMLVIAAGILNITINKTFKNNNDLYNEGMKIRKNEITEILEDNEIIKDNEIVEENLGNISIIDSSPINVKVTEEILNDYPNSKDKYTMNDVIEKMTYEEIDDNGNVNTYHYASPSHYYQEKNIDGIVEYNDEVRKSAIGIAEQNNITGRGK